jgi:D-amino-acid oxidase
MLERDSILIKNINKTFQTKNIKGMISFKDGRINALSLLKTLDKYLKHKKVNFLEEEIIKIKKSKNQWISRTMNNENIKSDMIILCNSLKAVDLIDNLSHNIKLKPVLGQAIEIDINEAEVDLLSLPKQFNINGKNIIPISKNKLIIGSTDEYCTKPEENTFGKLTSFLDTRPNWLMKGKISKKWFGIRSRPEGEPSPIMKNFENGLIVCTGFYKNGILLAPACSKWVANEIKNYLY